MGTRAGARRFAKAAFRLATQQAVQEDFVDRLQGLVRAFRELRGFRHLMATRRIPIEKKMEFLQTAYAGILSELEFGVLQLLLERNMGLQLPAVGRAVARLAQAEGATLAVMVTAPQRQSPEELQALEERISKETGRPTRVSSRVDASLLGGIRLRLGNILIDGSLSRRLALMKEQLA